jgi:hypothetical protein
MSNGRAMVAIGPPRDKATYGFDYRSGTYSPPHNPALLDSLRSMDSVRFVQPRIGQPCLDVELAPSSDARETAALEKVLKYFKQHGYTLVSAGGKQP